MPSCRYSEPPTTHPHPQTHRHARASKYLPTHTPPHTNALYPSLTPLHTRMPLCMQLQHAWAEGILPPQLIRNVPELRGPLGTGIHTSKIPTAATPHPPPPTPPPSHPSSLPPTPPHFQPPSSLPPLLPTLPPLLRLVQSYGG